MNKSRLMHLSARLMVMFQLLFGLTGSSQAADRYPQTGAEWLEYLREAESTPVAKPRYSVLAISNHSSQTLQYEYQWGDGEAHTVVLTPGQTKRHWWKHAAGSDGAAPRFHIMFAWTAYRNGYGIPGMEHYTLSTNRSTDTSYESARKYHFRTYNGHIDLRQRIQ